MFSTFKPIEIREKVFIGNSSTSKIKGQGKVVLNMMSAKGIDFDKCLVCARNSQELGVLFIVE